MFVLETKSLTIMESAVVNLAKFLMPLEFVVAFQGNFLMKMESVHVLEINY